MAKHVEQQNVIEMQCAGAAKQAEEQKKKNREIVLKLMRSIYFLAKNLIPHSTTYKELIELQVPNSNAFLEKHLSEGPSNAHYTSRFSARVLIEAIDIWIERKLMCSLQESPYFSILPDECQDISTQKELSICGRYPSTELPANSVALSLLSSISQGGFTGKKIFFAQITAKAFSYIRTAFGASRSRRVGVRSPKN